MPELYGRAGVLKLAFACLLTIILLTFSSCNGDAERAAAEMTGGTPAKGKAAILVLLRQT
jgi:hypothetical protein